MNRVGCGAPFYSMYIGPDGQFAPCCLYNTLDPVGTVSNLDDLKRLYNSEEMISLRKDLIEGKKPEKCNNCWRYEEKGLNAYREYFNGDQLYDDQIIKKSIYNDFKIDEIKIRHFDIRFSNKCNLKCRTCNSNFSSSWYADEVKLDWDFSKKKIKEIEDKESILDFIFSQLHNVQEIYFAGGEPLMMEEHYMILDKIIEIGRSKDIKIVYSSNFSKLKYGSWDVIKQWQHFDKVDYMGSLDGSYERGEYIRKNLIWSEVINNIERLISECPHVNFKYNPCVSLLNAYNFIDLHREWCINGYMSHEQMDVNILDHPDHLRISNLPDNHKDRLREKYNLHSQWLVKRYGWSHANDEIEKVIKFLDNDPVDGWEREFYRRQIRLDGLRNEKFFDVFTEYRDLDKLILPVK